MLSCSENERTKVAFVFNHSFFLGGGEISFSELIRLLNRESFEPLVFVPAFGEIADFYQRQKMRVLVTPFPPLKQALLSPFSSFRNLSFAIKKTKPDVLHANGSRACFYCVLAGRALGIPVIWHVRETLRDLYFYDGFLGLSSKSIVCVSKSVAVKRFKRFGRLLRSKIEVLHNGVDTSIFVRDEQERESLRKGLGIERGELLFGMLGNVIPLKGHAFFLSGLAEAKSVDRQLPAKAVIIGRRMDRRYHSELLQLINHMNLSDTVRFIDHTINVKAYLSALDVFVLPSQREGFSRALLEAMSSGLPVLASKIEEIEEAVADQKNALLVPFGDINSMASAIAAFCRDEALRKNMGLRNRKKAEEHFDLVFHVRAIEDIYRRVARCKT